MWIYSRAWFPDGAGLPPIKIPDLAVLEMRFRKTFVGPARMPMRTWSREWITSSSAHEDPSLSAQYMIYIYIYPWPCFNGAQFDH